MDIYHIFSLLGGLAMFLYGMHVMGESLEKQAGGKLRSLMDKLTANTFTGIVLGIIVTVIMQSSSATTVMVVGFVNSGLLTLTRSVPIIIGANIGTAVTPWILSLTELQSKSVLISMLKPANFSPILAFIGIAIVLFSKQESKKSTGNILLGFAILMYGMTFMSNAVEPLSEMKSFQQILTIFENPVFGVLVGTVVTAIIQSSAASVGMLQALSTTGSITFSIAIPIVVGQNIGTCITAIISCIGTNANAKRAALVHLFFNVIGGVVLLSMYYVVNAIIGGFSFMQMPVNAFYIALIHTVFKLINTAMLLPCSNLLVRLACFCVKDSSETEKFTQLDDRLLATPSVAVSQCKALTEQMARLAQEITDLSVKLIFNFNEEIYKRINEIENQLDMYEDKLGTYLVQISTKGLAAKDSKEISTLLHTIGDFERIGDHSVNIMESAKEMQDKKIHFSNDAHNELKILTAAINEIVELSISAFINDDVDNSLKVEPLEEVVDDLTIQMKNRHIDRLQKGQCTITLGFIFSDLINNMERIADHCSNIAICLIQMRENKYDAHIYLNELRDSKDPQFERDYHIYRNKYLIPSSTGD